jgi:hypothetical protein
VRPPGQLSGIPSAIRTCRCHCSRTACPGFPEETKQNVDEGMLKHMRALKTKQKTIYREEQDLKTLNRKIKRSE